MISMIGFDTLAAAHLLDEQRPLSLLDQASLELGVENWGKGIQQFGTDAGDPLELLGGKGKGSLGRWDDGADEPGMGTYCARDTAYSHLLYERQRVQLREQPGLAALLKHLVLPGLRAFARIEANGIYVDWDRVVERQETLRQRISRTTADILEHHVHAELRDEWEARARKKAKKGAQPRPILGNEHFLRAWLFGATGAGGLGLTPLSHTEQRGDPQVDEDTLERLDHPAARMLVTVRKDTKQLQFFEQWREWCGDDGRLHPYYNLTGTTTGRRSCDRPNLQQVPRDAFVRSCLGAPDGWVFLEVDFSQIEVRIVAWLADDEDMLRVFREGGDIYRYVAARLAGISEAEVTPELRRKAKAVVLGFLYGMGVRSFRVYAKDSYGVEFSEAEGKAWREGFFALFPGVVRWHERQRREARSKLQVESPVGRLRHLMDVLSVDDVVRGKAERQAINSPVQGFGGDWTLMTIVQLDAALPPDDVLIVGDIHDAVLFQVKRAVWRERAREILTIMENPALLQRFKIAPPLRMLAEGKVGEAWGTGTAFTLETLDQVVLAA